MEIYKGKSIKLWKDKGFYTLDFYPIVSIRIPEDEIKEVIEDLEEIVKKLKNK